jgi:lysylphosphatidylglycerol synthetase-like protein (DUF2156 family)
MQLILVTTLILSLFYVFQRAPTLPILYLEQIEYESYNSDSIFSVILLGLLPLFSIKRRKRIRFVLSLFLCLSSYLCWFSTNAWWSEYNIGQNDRRLFAIILLAVGFLVLILKSFKEKRRHFSEIVRREVIQKQKGKCASCKHKLLPFGMDLDHKNGDRTNNKPSYCQILCTPCHRRKHL